MTELAKKDRRYLRAEDKIRKLVFEGMSKKDMLGVNLEEICRRFDVNLRTFKRHYNNLTEAWLEIGEEIYRDYIEEINGLENSKVLVLKTIFFISKKKGYFISSLANDDYGLLIRIWSEIVCRRKNKNCEWMRKLLVSEIAAIMKDWSERSELSIKEAERYANLIEDLILTSEPRLRSLILLASKNE